MKHRLPDLESAIASVDFSEGHPVDWTRVRRSAYLIHQRLGYSYPGAIQYLQQRLVIVPPQQHGDQRLIDHRLTVTNPSADTTYSADTFGNTEITSLVPLVERAIEFEVWILVERHGDTGPFYLPAPALLDERYRKPSRLTQPDDALTKIAAQFRASGKQGIELADEINTWVYETMHYAHAVTDIHTTAATAFAIKQGVCQDYAHIMLALCRLCSLPARYVSGHLLGDGGTHAWVEVILPVDRQNETARVVPLDPTHGRQAGLNYVTIAVGRDYFDVAPTSGTYVAAYRGHLSTHKRVGLTAYEYMVRVDPERVPTPDSIRRNVCTQDGGRVLP